MTSRKINNNDIRVTVVVGRILRIYQRSLKKEHARACQIKGPIASWHFDHYFFDHPLSASIIMSSARCPSCRQTSIVIREQLSTSPWPAAEEVQIQQVSHTQVKDGLYTS
jgi:hypothetical protein